MARLLQQFVEQPRTCAYLPDEQAQLAISVLADVAPDELTSLLERGFRHFGPLYFRPVCAACDACVTLRIPVASFRPTRSQRRAGRTAAHLRRVVQAPIVDDERLALYTQWHRGRERDRDWEASPMDADRYAVDFAYPQETAREVVFYDGARIVGVGIVDETPAAVSAVYFFYDPTLRGVSLGTAHVLALIADAQAAGRAHVYLGYRVEGCASLAYKERFGPHELLVGRPGLRDAPQWVAATEEASEPA